MNEIKRASKELCKDIKCLFEGFSFSEFLWLILALLIIFGIFATITIVFGSSGGVYDI